MNNALRTIAAVLCSIATATALAQSSPLDDAQIADVAVTANTVDIDGGKLAEKKSHNKGVQAFAKEMVTDHSRLNEQASALAKKIHLTPEPSDLSMSLKKDGELNMSKLTKLKGKAFDTAYIDNEVTMHQSVLDTLNKTLIPEAKNPELKHMLLKALPIIEEHLQHAKALQAKLQ